MLDLVAFHELDVHEAGAPGGHVSSIYPSAPGATFLYDAATDSVLAGGVTTYGCNSVVSALTALGSHRIAVTPLSEWVVNFGDKELRSDIERGKVVLYTTIEPSASAVGNDPSIAELIVRCGFKRVVIGSPDPIPERSMLGSKHLHNNGLDVSICCSVEETDSLLTAYTARYVGRASEASEAVRTPAGPPVDLRTPRRGHHLMV